MGGKGYVLDCGYAVGWAVCDQVKGPFSSKPPTASSRKYNMSPRQLLLQAKRREGLLFCRFSSHRYVGAPGDNPLKAREKAASQNLGLGLEPPELPKEETCRWPGLRSKMGQKGIQGDRPST